MATVIDLKNKLAQEELYLDQLRQQLAVARTNNREDRIAFFQNEITKQQSQISQTRTQLDQALKTAALATQSTATTVREDQVAREPSANPVSPPTPPLVLGSDGRIVSQAANIATNAVKVTTRSAFDAAVDAALGTTGVPANPRNIRDLMSTPASSSQAPPPNQFGPTAPQNRGEAAAGDDNSTRSTLNRLFTPPQGRPIQPEPNALSALSSYTYNISIYITSQEQYNQLLKTKKKTVAGWQLLMQSGGAPVGAGATPDTGQTTVGETVGQAQSTTQGRNQFFPVDFYLDDVKLRGAMPGKGSGSAHGLVSLEFKVIEPNGLTFLNRLRDAAAQFIGGDSPDRPVNYASQIYMMVIRFYGYDQYGNLIGPVQDNLVDANGIPSNNQASIEKFIPFMFSSIKFRAASRMVEYDCLAVCPQYGINASRGRGTIPYNVEVTAKSLQDLFSGPLTYTTGLQTDANQSQAETNRLARQGSTSATTGLQTDANQSQAETNRLAATAPPKASSAPTPTITQGLAAALNQYQNYLVNVERVYTIPDQYEIEVLPPLNNALVVPPGTTDYKSKPMGPGPGAPAADQKDPAKGQVQKDAKVTSILAGMSILQFIDQFTRQSTYIYDQQLAIIDASGKQKPNPAGANQVMAWYRIGMEAEQLGYDYKRNDYAYRIKYQVQPYKIYSLQSDWFPDSPFRGAHKKYDYWFTGTNTEVLDFSIDYNTMYYLVISVKDPEQFTGRTTNYRESYKKIAQPNSSQSNFGITGNENEPSANAADYLYSPSDVAKAKLSILGDPAWIPQGEVWAGVFGQSGFNPDAFLSDGTINFDSQEPLFEVTFNKPVDFDLNTGLQDVGQNNYGADRAQGRAGDAVTTYIYRAVECTSIFSKGKFTQELIGTIVLFDSKTTQAIETTRQTSATPEAQVSRSPTPALSSDGSVNFEGSEFGAYFGSGTTGGEVNYAPKGLAQVLDARPPPPPNPLATSSLEAEGFIAPAAPVEAPTSSGQPVGVSGTAPRSQPPANIGSVSTIPSSSGISPLQQQLIIKRTELAQATSRGNFTEATRLNREIQDLSAKLLRESPPAPVIRTQNIAKD